MYRNVNEFRERFRRWKAGLLVYDRGLIVPIPEYRDGKDGKQNTTYAPNAAYGLASSSFMLPEVVVTGKNRKKSIPRQVLEAIKDTDLAYIENPSVMTAAGHTAKISQVHEPTKDERALGNTLAGIGLAGTAALAAPTVLSYLTPGSSFWMNPIIKQMMAGTAAVEGVNLGTKVLTGRNSFGQLVGDAVEDVSGWNPNNTWWGPIVTESLNPGWYRNPNSVMNAVGRAGSSVEKGLNKTMTLYNSPLTGNWTRIGNKEYRLSPNSLGVNGSPIESRKIGEYAIDMDLNKMRSIFEDYEKSLYQYKGLKDFKLPEYHYELPKIDFSNLVKDNFVDYLSRQTGRTLKRVPIKDTKHGDIYNEGFAFIDENGKEVAYIAGRRKSGKNVWVESSFVDPEFRYQGLGKQMYFDLNNRVFGTYGTTLHSDPMQRVGSTGVGMSPSNRLWKSLREKGWSSVEGEGFNRYDVMAEPSKITTAFGLPEYRGGKDDGLPTDAILRRQVPLELQQPTPEQVAAARDAANQLALLMVLLKNLTYMEPAQDVPKQLQEYYADKEDTRRFMARKKAVELATDEMMLSLIDPRYIAAGWAIGKGAQWLSAAWKAAKTLTKTYRLARAIKKAVKNTKIEPVKEVPGQVGWAPKTTVEGYHASDVPDLEPDFWFDGWALKRGNAPGFYIAGGEAPEEGFLAKRQYLYDAEATFDRPMVQIGERKAPVGSKNISRGLLERTARDMGADGIIYLDIADNQMAHQHIAHVLHPDVNVKVTMRPPKNVRYGEYEAVNDAGSTFDMTAATRRRGKPVRQPYANTIEVLPVSPFQENKQSLLMPNIGVDAANAELYNAAIMTPTERVFKFLGKEVPEEKASEWVRPEGLSPGKNARWSLRHNTIYKHPTILDLKAQGVDVEKLTLDDLRQLIVLREEAIKKALSANNGRYAITDAGSGAKLFGENVDAELQTTKGRSVEPGAIGSLTFENMPLDRYLELNWARYDREGAVPFINPELYEGFKVPGMIQNYARDYGVTGVSKDLYSAALFDMMERGTGKGIASGTVLLSPEKTTRVVAPKNFNLVEISPNAGWHQYSTKTLDGTPIASWQEGPIVGMTGTTSPIQIPVKNKDIFDVNIIDNNGIMHVNPKVGSSVSSSINTKKQLNGVTTGLNQLLEEEKIIPNSELMLIRNSTLERMADARGLTGEERAEYIKRGMAKLGTKYTSTHKLNNLLSEAEYDWSTGEIRIRPGQELFALGHEMRHKIDGIGWLTGEGGYNLTPEEYGILRSAYTGPFFNYPGDMLREMTTTNADVRKMLIGAHNLRNMSVAELNALIDKKTLGEVFLALKNSNDYGFEYYKSIMTDPIYRENGAKLMIDIGRKIKKAVKAVGMFSVPLYLSIPKSNKK